MLHFQIGGSPVLVHVMPGDVVAAKCVVSGDGCSKATAGEPATFSISAADAHGNPCPLEKGRVSAYITTAGKKIKCKKKGDHWVYTPPAAGQRW